ncbi:MAG: hypothetical protein KAH14_03515 [Clostridiales bacterium]|nr:hypothetical protein [Clostridiales bacterium]
MNGRDRFLAAINNQKADRLPCQVHSWMSYYLKTYLNNMNSYEAYDYFGMDPVIYQNPSMLYSEKDRANWIVNKIDLGTDSDGVRSTRIEVTTPEGTMVEKRGDNPITGWITEHMIKTKKDFELWNKYFPIPIGVDWAPVIKAKNKIGNSGIVRGGYYDFGQGSPWQSFAYMFGTEEIIMAAIDEPDWLNYVMNTLLEKKLRVIELGGKIEMDLIETGGGAGSSTVISPTIHEEFCLPYDQKQHAALHTYGGKAVYHLCGGFMPLLDLVVENGADGLETMTPPIMGGDCIMSECTRRIGDRMFFIGGFDQNAGFEKGTPELARQMVFDLHKDCPDGGYIVSPSDHFFYGDPKNLQAFVDAAKECTY